VIAALLSSWALFHHAFLATWISAALLALVGVAVIARGTLFLGVAAAQAATAAVAGALFLAGLGWLSGTGWAMAAAIIAAMATALLPLLKDGGEAANGWLFLAAGAATPLLLARSPHGLEEVRRLVASSVIGADAGEVVALSLLFIATVLVVLTAGRRLRVVLADPVFAADLGVAVGRWQVGIALGTGLVIGLALRCAGLLHTAGCLILPGLAAAQLCRTTASMTLVAPLLSSGVAVIGTVAADTCDLPPAQVTVAALALVAAGAWGWRRMRS
jgi:ABC-type Mn2+/Zn2+ transport system permease subunit